MENKKLTSEQLETLKKATTYHDRYLINIRDFGIVDNRKAGRIGKLKDGIKEGSKEDLRKELKLSYISWAYAEYIGNIIDEKFDWELLSYDVDGAVIKMTFLGKTRTMKYPYLDNKNQAILEPDSFQKNNAQMRGMSKLFSMLSGIGLGLYTGEDLPTEFVSGGGGVSRDDMIAYLDKNLTDDQKQQIFSKHGTSELKYLKGPIMKEVYEKVFAAKGK